MCYGQAYVKLLYVSPPAGEITIHQIEVPRERNINGIELPSLHGFKCYASISVCTRTSCRRLLALNSILLLLYLLSHCNEELVMTKEQSTSLSAKAMSVLTSCVMRGGNVNKE